MIKVNGVVFNIVDINMIIFINIIFQKRQFFFITDDEFFYNRVINFVIVMNS